MKQTVLILVVFLAAGVPSSAGAGDTRGVLTQIRQIAKDEAQSYERLLARASPLANEAYKDRKWGEIEEALKSAGVKPVLAAGGGAYTDYRCVVLTNACAIKGGCAMDLYLSFGVSGGRSQPTYSIPPDFTVFQAAVGLSATPLAQQEQVRKEQWFGKGTIIQEALSAWPVRDALPAFPVLAAVDISFGEISDPAADSGGQGYRVQLVLVKGKDDRQSSRRLECSAAVSQKRGETRGPVGGWLSRDEPPSGAARKLADDLRRVVKEKEPSYQRLLCKATHLVQKAALGRQWSAVSQELNGQGLRPLDEHPWQYGRLYKYLVTENAYTTAGGQSMDLFVKFETWWETSKSVPTREMVCEAYPGLCAKVQTTYAQALSEARFGKDTAIHKALLHEEARKAAEKCPFLNAVEVHYDVIADRWQPLHSWGFSVRPEFIRGKGDASASMSLNLTVPSGLDPPKCGGSTVLVKDFIPKDTLGDPFCWGSSGSGSSGSARGGRKTTFFLTRKGAPQWRKTGDKETEPIVAYGVGDLKSLPPKTPAITVENQEVYDGDLAVLGRFTDLQILNMAACQGITDGGLQRLAGLKKLRSLTLSGERLSGIGFRHLHGLPALTDLRLRSSRRLTDQGIAALAEMKQLTGISLAWADALSRRPAC